MFKSIIRICLLVIFGIFLLGLGGYTVDSFKHEIHLRNPRTVLSPLTQYVPDIPDMPKVDTNNLTTENSENSTTEDKYIDENGNLKKQDIEEIAKNTENEITKTNIDNSTISISYIKSIKVTINGEETEFTSANTINFIKWLNNNYSTNSDITYVIESESPETTLEDTSENIIVENTTETSTESVTEENTEISTEETSENNTEESYEIDYTATTLKSESELNNLIKTITVVDALPEYNDYDRVTFEKPVKGYKLNGNKLNRNDYAWRTSKWFNKNDFTYTCPYTGTIIKDEDDGKTDNDYGQLDYDHIVPLKSTYIRGAKDWTDEQKNEYAYNQWVGVDVLNSANRSKSDKGPTEYLPDINIEDYCYSWLLICSKYKLSMTQAEIDVCRDNINIALKNGEEVTFLGGSYEIN